MSEAATAQQETKPETQPEAKVLFDAAVEQRFVFDVVEGGAKYETAHRFRPLDDERYVQYIKDFNVKADETDGSAEATEEISEASVKLWDDLILEVENIEVEGDQDFRELIDYKEKSEGINSLLAVVVLPPEAANGKRKLSKQNEMVVVTEAYFNGQPVQQTHRLQAKTLEWEKKFNRIAARQYKEESTKGLRKKRSFTYVPQDEAFGKLYDEMKIEAVVFVGDIIPLRFKTVVMDYVFASPIKKK